MSGYPADHGAGLRDWISAHLKAFRVESIEDPAAQLASVAVALVPDHAGRGCFVLTRRSPRLKNHGGQWALPGGKGEPRESREATALRELHEEVGLHLDGSSVLGHLDDFKTRSGFVIRPVVVWCEDYRELRPDPSEVAKVYRVPIADLDRPDAPVLTEIPESDRPVLSMPILGGLVHAPTAAIIYQLLEVALRGRSTRVAHFEQPVFAWR